MRQITFEDVQDTFLDRANAERSADVCHPEHGMAIASMLVDLSALKAMDLGEDDVMRIAVMVFGGFTAGVMTAQRLIEEDE